MYKQSLSIASIHADLLIFLTLCADFLPLLLHKECILFHQRAFTQDASGAVEVVQGAEELREGQVGILEREVVALALGGILDPGEVDVKVGECVLAERFRIAIKCCGPFRVRIHRAVAGAGQGRAGGDQLPGPDAFRSAVSPYLKNDKLLDGFVYTFPGGSINKIQSPAETELGYVDTSGGRAVVYADGHAKFAKS